MRRKGHLQISSQITKACDNRPGIGLASLVDRSNKVTGPSSPGKEASLKVEE
jgi:hypothetical protein